LTSTEYSANFRIDQPQYLDRRSRVRLSSSVVTVPNRIDVVQMITHMKLQDWHPDCGLEIMRQFRETADRIALSSAAPVEEPQGNGALSKAAVRSLERWSGIIERDLQSAWIGRLFIALTGQPHQIRPIAPGSVKSSPGLMRMISQFRRCQSRCHCESL
jgi:hypothetical protein